jgi:hypothetical protein
MPEPTQITCPKCKSPFALDAAIAAPMVAEVRKEYERQLDEVAKASAVREAELLQKEQSLELSIQQGVAARRAETEAQVRAVIEAEQAAELNARDERNKELEKKLGESQEAQIAAIRAKQAAEDKAASAELEIAKRVSAESAAIREQAMKDAQEAERAKSMEKDLLIANLKQQAEELKRKAEIGSQQLQGEAAELDLEELLESAFPTDEISEIQKGVRGADTLQVVNGRVGNPAGSILWERKNAQAWGGDWLQKAKLDQRSKKADLVVIVSQCLPKDTDLFDCHEDVWVVSPKCALQLAKALRAGLIDLAGARRTAEGRKTNAQRAYDYLLGSEFAMRLKGIAEPFVQLQEDLDSERRTMTQRWARRQKQIDRVLEAAFGMRGDIEALAGSELPELDAIAIKALTEPSAVVDEASA